MPKAAGWPLRTERVRTTERIERLLDPEFLKGIRDRDNDALRAMRGECATIESSLSYYRRLAQGRMEILDAERSRRAEGGSVEDLIARLPDILGSDQQRAGGANSRLATDAVIELDLGGRAALVADDTLAKLPALGADELEGALDHLTDFERDLSESRQQLHTVIDAIDREIAARAAADVG